MALLRDFFGPIMPSDARKNVIPLSQARAKIVN